jgi:DNA-binding response OmpR family regulator
MARILVVDDDALVCEIIVSALRTAKHTALEAGDGRQALDVLDREPVDLVVTDIMMPEIDGIGLILAIRKQHPNLRVLCISGGDRIGNMDYLPMAGKLGANMVLAKPFTPKQLLAAVEAALRMPAKPKASDRATDER